MKKTLGLVAICAALTGLLVSCASTKSNEKFVSSVAHPRTYVIDLADAITGNVTKFSAPQGTYFGGNNDFTGFLKYDPPQVGDTFEIHYKGVSDIDIPGIELCIGNHNTWQNLISQDQCAMSFHDDIKAGVPFEGVKTYVLDGTAPGAKGSVWFDFYYDNCLVANNGYPVTGKAAKITWEKTDVETTDTSKDEGLSVTIVKHPAEAVTFNINVADTNKMVQYSVGDADDAGNVTNYKSFINVTESPEFKDYLPKKGDTVTFTFKGTSDSEITQPLQVALVDQSEAAGWWLEVGADNWNTVWADSIPADDEFEITGSMTLAKDCIGGLTVFVIYTATEDATGATWIYSRN